MLGEGQEFTFRRALRMPEFWLLLVTVSISTEPVTGIGVEELTTL